MLTAGKVDLLFITAKLNFMQQFFSTILAFILAIFGVSNSPNVNIPSSAPSPIVTNKFEIEFNQNKYFIYLQKITDPKNLSLISNFSEKTSSSEIMKIHNCSYGINGGFYTPDNKALGLFIIEDMLYGYKSTSTLVNGYIFKGRSGKLYISSSPDEENDPAVFIMQSGPYFTPSTKLKIIDDQPARRMLVGKTDNDDFYFLTITTFDNTLSGPLLGDLPQIISVLNSQLNARRYTLNALLNLDGGSASAFYSDTGTQLSELTPIGSFLCGR